MDEIELKLELAPHDADALAATGLLADGPVKARQRSIYFDTPDRSLEKAGLSLRIRRSGRKRIQTVKADGTGSAGLFARPEWERAVADDTPIVDRTTPVRALLGRKVADIAPAFEVRVERRKWDIREGEAGIELVLDRGEVLAGGRRAPICEVELELKQGDPVALFAFARRIDGLVPVRLGVLTKAERGYGLVRGAVGPFKAERVLLGRDITAGQAFQRIVQSCTRQFRLNEGLLLNARQPEALHQARVALRRLRSAFSIFGAVFDDAGGAGLRGELRWLAAELGDARNLDVMLARSQPGPLHDRLAAAREAAYVRVETALASPRARALMLDMTQWIVTGPWLGPGDTAPVRDLPMRVFASAAMDRLRRRVKRDGRGLSRADDEARHDLRKDAKKLRYAAGFFAALFTRKRERRRYKRFIVALEALQDELGGLNDLATAPAMLSMLDVDDLPGAPALLAAGDKAAMIDAAEARYDTLVDARRFWR